MSAQEPGGCVCGHAKFLHTATACLKWFLGCGCAGFETPEDADKGSVFPAGSGSERYDGFYANKKWSA